VCNKQLAFDQEDVRLDVAETIVERIKQRPIVGIIVVRVGIRKRFDLCGCSRWFAC
jgi:hypothetical protein